MVLRATLLYADAAASAIIVSLCYAYDALTGGTESFNFLAFQLLCCKVVYSGSGRDFPLICTLPPLEDFIVSCSAIE